MYSCINTAIFAVGSFPPQLRSVYGFCKTMKRRLSLEVLLERDTNTKVIKCYNNPLDIGWLVSSSVCALSGIESKAIKIASSQKSHHLYRTVRERKHYLYLSENPLMELHSPCAHACNCGKSKSICKNTFTVVIDQAYSHNTRFN